MSVHPHYASGALCYYCGDYRCCCDELEAEAEKRERAVQRTKRLVLAIDIAEARAEELEGLSESHPDLPELKERITNLTRALLTHRRAMKGM